MYQYLLQVPHQPSNAEYFDAATVQQQPRFKFFAVWQTSTVLLLVCVSVCHPRVLQQAVGTMNTMCGSISASLFLLFCLLLLMCMYHPVLQALYVVAAMVQQQPHFKVSPLWQPRTVFCECACLCVFVCHPEHDLDDCNRHFL